MGLLKVASDQVPFGIYAIEKNGYAELRCDRCQSMTKLKELVLMKLPRELHILTESLLWLLTHSSRLMNIMKVIR